MATAKRKSDANLLEQIRPICKLLPVPPPTLRQTVVGDASEVSYGEPDEDSRAAWDSSTRNHQLEQIAMLVGLVRDVADGKRGPTAAMNKPEHPGQVQGRPLDRAVQVATRGFRTLFRRYNKKLVDELRQARARAYELKQARASFAEIRKARARAYELNRDFEQGEFEFALKALRATPWQAGNSDRRQQAELRRLFAAPACTPGTYFSAAGRRTARDYVEGTLAHTPAPTNEDPQSAWIARNALVEHVAARHLRYVERRNAEHERKEANKKKRKRNQDSLEERRIDAVRRINKGEPRDEVCRGLGVSKSSLSKWVTLYKNGGMKALRSKALGAPKKKTKKRG